MKERDLPPVIREGREGETAGEDSHVRSFRRRPIHPRLQERHRPPHRRLRLQPRPGDGFLRRRPGRGAGRQATPRRRGGGHRCAEGGVASRRRRRRRQDRRWRRHPRRDPAGLLQGPRARFERPGARGRPHRRRHGVPAAHRLGRAGALPHHRRDRDPARRPHHPGLAPGAGRHLGDRREGQRHAARDRADPDRPRQPPARQPRVREAALHPAPAHGEGGARREHRRVLRLLASAAARSSTRACSWPSICRPSTPTCSTSASPRASPSSTSAIRPTPSRNGSSPSRSACWRTTARSTPSWATSTG